MPALAPGRRRWRWDPGPISVVPGRDLAGSGGGGSSDPSGTHREAPGGVHLDHAAQQALAVGRDEVRHVKHASLHLLQQLPQVVVVEGQRPLPAGDRGHLGRGAQGQRRGGRGGASPPTGRTGSRRSSTRLPCGRHTSPPAGGSGVGGVSGQAPQRGWSPGTGVGGRRPGPRGSARLRWRSPLDGQRRGGGAVTTYPDHLGAGVVGGSGGKSSSQARGSGPAVCPGHPTPPALRAAPQDRSSGATRRHALLCRRCPSGGPSGPLGGSRGFGADPLTT